MMGGKSNEPTQIQVKRPNRAAVKVGLLIQNINDNKAN